MQKRHSSLILAGTSVLLALASAVAWVGPHPAQAQAISCPQQTQTTTTGSTTTTTTTGQAVRLNPSQKQALCLAADQLERHNISLTVDLTSALFPGSAGPVGPLSMTDIAAHTSTPAAASIFDATVGAAATGLSGSILANAALVGYLRALTQDGVV
jgi:hypothetical protein